ncbi:hypothetical protein GCM10009718_34050 [Isoptericola halotolerans]|uniref:histidine kinase n=1 Tax=Isoptericola halotolerans TaxID=300560 RepID=A0ABX2A550_9MICO|nr:PAS and ANTAR domain-containing protein [Isoptericola halotolerans]NOV97053.1 hypothetical protein [Isoptericola halotolerans]
MTSTTPTETRHSRADRTRPGRYQVDLDTETWWWSDETYRIHGFEPGEVVPTTEMVLAHKHPDDRDTERHVLDDARRTGEPFSTVHRILDVHSEAHVVSVVGEGRRDERGTTVSIASFVHDLTDSVSRFAAEQADASIRAAASSRRDIEQAKILVRLALEVDDDEAFSVLRRSSNHSNVPLRTLSQHVVREVDSSASPDRPFEASRVLAVLKAPPAATPVG